MPNRKSPPTAKGYKFFGILMCIVSGLIMLMGIIMLFTDPLSAIVFIVVGGMFFFNGRKYLKAAKEAKKKE